MATTHNNPGLFVALEGVHGSGKSTQAKRLATWLSDQGFSVETTREVGGTILGEKLRDLIAAPEWATVLATDPKSLLFLVLAARSLHVQQVIRPALSSGKLVICERFEGSTYAIQHYADQLDWPTVHQMHTFACEGLTPDLTILLQVPAQLGISRKRRQNLDGFWDTRPFEYHERISQGYREAIQRFRNWVVVDGTRDEDAVFVDLQGCVSRYLRT